MPHYPGPATRLWARSPRAPAQRTSTCTRRPSASRATSTASCRTIASTPATRATPSSPPCSRPHCCARCATAELLDAHGLAAGLIRDEIDAAVAVVEHDGEEPEERAADRTVALVGLVRPLA